MYNGREKIIRYYWNISKDRETEDRPVVGVYKSIFVPVYFKTLDLSLKVLEVNIQ